MKILLACEGESEVYLLRSLIYKGQLHFSCPLVMEEPIKLRQLTEIAPIINVLPINEEIIIFRVGDTLKESFSLSKFKMSIYPSEIGLSKKITLLYLVRSDLSEILKYIALFGHGDSIK